MDTRVKSLSWIGNIREKFETFYSEIDDIVKENLEYGENQLLTAGANVKQFCSEFMEEVLPESIINSLQEKTTTSENAKRVVHAGGLPDKEANAGHKDGPSDCNSSNQPILMETVEEADITLSFTLKANDGREMSFEENRVKETEFSSEILKFEGHGGGGFRVQKEAGETNDFDPQDGIAKLSTAQPLPNAIVSPGSNARQLLENELSSSGRTLSKELINAEGLNGHTAEETKGKHVSDLGIMQLPNKLKIEDSSTVLDSNEYHLTSDCPEQPQAHHRTACKSCLAMELEKHCECERAAGSKGFNAESDQPEDKLPSQALLAGESELLDEELCESDWVIV
ncbi:uncharacterized protein [Coffea arabica]|uniref:Uncharacterized protein LOC113731058 isoform X1 n=1 Tax=Coffea arabica TaxID=13443 RepID=A0A6P6WBB7_COFAR|nr:uncharacterized protein LOC113731058 isoform X1 [Coffea arabica]